MNVRKIFQGQLVREDRDYDFWYGYSSDTLTKLCVAFNVPQSGTKKEKAARLCFAYELGFDVTCAGDEEKIIEQEKKSKLMVRGLELPNPERIADNSWILGLPATLPVFERRQITDYFARDPFISPSDLKELDM
jgi:hypothetical protein